MMILSFDHFKRTYVIRSHTHEVCSETIKKNLPFQKTTTSGSFKMIIFTRSLMDTSELTGETLRGCEFFSEVRR